MVNPQSPGKVQGYKSQPQSNVDLVNEVKDLETQVALLWKKVRAHNDVDRRMHALARTHFEDGFMWLVRSVFQPNTEFDR